MITVFFADKITFYPKWLYNCDSQNHVFKNLSFTIFFSASRDAAIDVVLLPTPKSRIFRWLFWGNSASSAARFERSHLCASFAWQFGTHHRQLDAHCRSSVFIV